MLKFLYKCVRVYTLFSYLNALYKQNVLLLYTIKFSPDYLSFEFNAGRNFNFQSFSNKIMLILPQGHFAGNSRFIYNWGDDV